MRQEQKAIIRIWAAQKGVQYQDTFGRGYALPVRIIITAGSCSDIGQSFPLIQGIDAQFILADRAYSVHKFGEQLKVNGV